MTERFFDTLSEEEKQGIKGKTAALAELMQAWAQSYARIRTVRIPPVALLITTVVPRISLPDSLLVAKMIFWIFELDDIADERVITLAEVRQKAEEWYCLARDCSNRQTPDGDELAAILLEIREGLSKFDLFGSLREEWATNVRLLVEAMAQEYHYGLQYNTRTRMLPSLDEYVYYGTSSFGFPLWGLTVLIIQSDPSTLKCLPFLREAIRYGGAAMRLYNDYQTLEKERQEGNVSSVIITYHALLNENLPAFDERILSEARQQVLHQADSYAQRCADRVGQIQTASGQMEETISRIVAFHAYFYSRHDYHTTSLVEVARMLDPRHTQGESLEHIKLLS